MEEYNYLDISEIQTILLENYKIVSDICKKHKLKIFAIGGTALGAVREKGFIPWDDDIDLGLSRKDYEYIIENKAELEKDLPEYLRIIKRKRHHIIAVADMRYKVERVDELNGGYISVDFFPIEGTSDRRFTRLFHSVKVFFYRACYKMCYPELIWMGNWRPRWQIVLIKLMKKLRFLFRNPEKLGEKWENSMKKYDYDEQNYIAIYTGKYLFKDVYPKSWFEPGIEIPFEATKVLMPIGYDNYLHQIYGDYMTPPSESERDSHIS